MVERLWKTKRTEGNLTGYTDQKGEKPGLQKKTDQKKRREKGEEMEGGGKGEKKPRALLCWRSIRILSVSLHPQNRRAGDAPGGGPSAGHTPAGPAHRSPSARRCSPGSFGP